MPNSDVPQVNVPLIPAPPEDDIDDAANKEAAGFGSGNLALNVRGCTRSMTAYTITSSELDGLSIWNTLSNIAYTTAFSLWSFASALFIQALFMDFKNAPPLAQSSCYLGIPAAVLLGVVCCFVAKFITKKSKDLREIITSETNHESL
ncbi:MAG: hypothetical protein KTR28_09170 [Micavibrio sp.]|nr:hypothetical protein [Micavibrio sp.]